MSTSSNAILYRCPTCNDIVITVPPGFEAPTDEVAQAAAAEHMKKHDEVREIVEGADQ